MGKSFHKALTLLLLALAAQPLSAQEKTEQKDSLVRLMKGSSVSLVELDGKNYRKAIDATFLHNGTYLICDTALWNVEEKVINAFGHVQIIQDETILTSEKLDYFIDDNLAQFRGGVVQLQNKKLNTLRTRHLDYNTKDSLAVFKNGGAMRDEDGQIIEGLEGTYDSSAKIFTFQKDVDMFTDSAFVKTELLNYYSDLNKAEFPVAIDFWKDENMLSASRGWYDRGSETFFFRDKVHALGEKQEAWSDTMYYYRSVNNLEMHGMTQLQDESRDVASLSKYVFYDDSLSRVTLKDEAAVALFSDTDRGRDTLYIGGDVLIYETIRKCDIPQSELDAAEKRLHDMYVDPVNEYRAKAAEAAAAAAKAAAEKAAEDDPALAAQKRAAELRAAREAAAKPVAADQPQEDQQAGDEESQQDEDVSQDEESQQDEEVSQDDEAPEDAAEEDAADRLESAFPGPLPVAADSSLVAPADSLLREVPDSASLAPLDTTKFGFVTGIGRVQVFRSDIQALCDSLRYNDLDSIARLYINPKVWNETNRQYISDSLFVLVKDGAADRASLQSNAFIMVQEDSLAFDQIKGTEVMAYFDQDANLKRFDALGGASAIFYLEEEGSLVTVNKVSSKMLSANLVNGEVDKVFYYDAPKNDAYPRAQVTEADSRMKGFDWTPELRPKGKADITTLTLRPSERGTYTKRRRPKFTQTNIYFPGYMKKIYGEIAVRDSLRRLPRPEQPSVSADTLAVLDSLSAAAQEVQMPDSLGVEVPVDSLAVEPFDTLSTALPAVDEPAVDPFAAEREADELAKTPEQRAADEKAAKKAEAAAAAAAKKAERQAALEKRLAEQEARWARLDSLDSLKTVAKQLKALEKQRAKTRKALIRKARQDKKDQAKLEKYIKLYERKKAREERKQRAPGGHRVLRLDGSADDGDILRRGSISGT